MAGPVRTVVAQRVTSVMSALVDQLLEVIREEGWNDPCITTVFPGEAVPFDYCSPCDDGMAWVRLVDVAPVLAADSGTGIPCAEAWNATVEVGFLFGAAVPTEVNGELVLPDAVQQANDALRQYEAMGIGLCALTTFDPGEAGPVTPGTYAPIGPDGLCVGGTWTATVGLV